MQALEVIPLLKATMPLERAQMRIRAVLSGRDTHKLRDKIAKLATSVESEDRDGGQLNMVCTYEVE
jgi:ribosome maturation protein SDO1